jgi:anti-sigma regulatory factor (Ser/Thr protein kinase)
MPAPAKLPADAVRHWATQAIRQHTTDLTAALCETFKVTRAAAATAVRQLETEGFIVRTRTGTRPAFAPGPSRLLNATEPLPGLDESLIWERSFAPWLDHIPPNQLNIAHYGFTEMVNNANDHAGGTQVALRCAVTSEALYLWITDDGIGVFERVRQALGLADTRLALLELSKGKVTTDPSRHSGEGLFFTSRVFSEFEMLANGLRYVRHNSGMGPTSLERLEDTATHVAPGTRIFLTLRRDATHSLREVFDHYTTGAPDDLNFDRTVVPVKLAQLGNENLLSRSQARRLISRIERFKLVELDFSDITEIGQAFADELFRVFVNEHPQIELRAINAGSGVLPMIRRVQGGR